MTDSPFDILAVNAKKVAELFVPAMDGPLLINILPITDEICYILFLTRDALIAKHNTTNHIKTTW